MAQFTVNFAGDVSYGYLRGMLRGVTRYNRTQGHWKFVLDPLGISSVIKRAKSTRIDAVIGQFNDLDDVHAVQRAGIIAVNISNRVGSNLIARVVSDDFAVGELAARYFMERGFRSFAYFGMGGRLEFSRLRGEGFIHAIEKAGLGSVRICPPVANAEDLNERGRGRLDWIKSLPEQTAVFAANDHVGRGVVEACLELGRAVPDDIAVLGVDNDEVQCELADVPLSSIQLASEKIGYDAAALCADLLAGKPKPPEAITVLPINVVTRQSSDILAVQDEQVRAAIRYIRENATKGIQVKHVLSAVQLSRRMLELRFRKAMNCTVHDEISRVRVEAAKRMLAESDMPVSEIARLAGFREAFYLSTSFRRTTGITPRDYRRQFRLS
jgi:LacI family transcriptional regulator